MSVLPFDELAPGKTVRYTIINEVQYLSIRDLIMVVCEKNNNRAAEIWSRLDEAKKKEVTAYCGNFQFPGSGQSSQPVITFPGAIKLMMFLPGENAKKFRSKAAEIITRYFAGDKSLIAEIERNAASDDPICQTARNSIETEDALKRKRVHDDMDIEERQLSIQERKIAIKASELDLKNKEFMNPISNLTTVIQIGGWEHRDDIRMRSMLANLVDLYHRNITGVKSVDANGVAEFTSIPIVANKMGLAKELDYNRVGRIASDKFLAKHGMRPREKYGKHKERTADGIMVEANDYMASDEPLLREAIEDYLKEMEAKKAAVAFVPKRMDYLKMAK